MMRGDLNWGMNNLEYNPNLTSVKHTCYKKANGPTSKYVILTKRKEYFCGTTVIEPGPSDHHKMTVTCLKRYFKFKQHIFCRNSAD